MNKKTKQKYDKPQHAFTLPSVGRFSWTKADKSSARGHHDRRISSRRFRTIIARRAPSGVHDLRARAPTNRL